MVLKVGIVGCGNIGLELARFVHQHRAFTLQAVADVEPEPIRRLLIEIQPDQPETLDLAGLVDAVEEGAIEWAVVVGVETRCTCGFEVGRRIGAKHGPEYRQSDFGVQGL